MLLLVYLLGVVDWLLIGWLVALMYYVFHSVFVDVLFRLVFLLVFLFVCLVCGVCGVGVTPGIMLGFSYWMVLLV